MKYADSIRNSLEELILAEDAVIIGEDIAEPYGGAFKVTKGLSAKYMDNFIPVPMCEQGFAGLGIGMALSGIPVIVEIMFGDFVTLVADQMINHAAKLHSIFHERLKFVVRTPMGAYRGYGATHSQCLERLFFGVPGINIVAPSILHNPGRLLMDSLESAVPTLYVENKTDYGKDLIDNHNIGELFELTADANSPGTVCVNIKGEKPDVAIVTYGGMCSLAMEASEKVFMQDEVAAQIIAVSDLVGGIDSIENFLKANKVITLEEGPVEFGFGSECIARLANKGLYFQRVGAAYSFIPAGSAMEKSVLPSPGSIINGIKKVSRL